MTQPEIGNSLAQPQTSALSPPTLTPNLSCSAPLEKAGQHSKGRKKGRDSPPPAAAGRSGDEEGPAVLTWPSQPGGAPGRGTKGLEELKQGTHRASWHNLAQQSTLTLQASQKHHIYRP